MRIDVLLDDDPQPEANSAPAKSTLREQDRQRKHAALNHPSINQALRVLGGEIIEIQAIDEKASKPTNP